MAEIVAIAVLTVAALWLIFVLPLHLTRMIFGAIDDVSYSPDRRE